MGGIDVLVLGGGYGTRLFSELKTKTYLPKGLIKINNFTCLDLVLKSFSKKFLGKIIIETNNEGFPSYYEWAKKNKEYKTKIIVEPISSPNNCLGVLKTLEYIYFKLKFKREVLLIAPDNIFFENQDRLILDKTPADAKILIYSLKNKGDVKKYGMIELDKSGHVISCKEKPEKPSSRIIRTSCEVWSPRMFKLLREWNKTRNSDKVGDYINFLVKRGYKIKAIPTEGEWIDIGTKKDLLRARRMIKR